ncbi:MAG: hypothetical protein NC342_06255 [Pseudoflavonifractor sp.]|nr:hypothetical protein [Alloprevotella sp.]MCM1117120.1 hypothetical protein [Pseudoflavonifractor sp.]
MKRTSFILASFAALAMSMTGCKDTTDGGVMQVNPQLPEVEASAFSFATIGEIAAGSVDLNSAAAPIQGVTVTYTGQDPLPEGSVISVDMQVSSTEDFSEVRSIALTPNADNTSFAVDPQLWDNAFRSLLGKAPAAQTNYVRFAGYLNIGTQRSRIGDLSTWFAPASASVTPIDLGIVVEEAYYLVGTVNGWDLASAVKFSHSDKNVYDDPVFTLNIDITAADAEAGWWWKIVPESAFKAQSWDGLYGTETDGDTAPAGNLFKDGQAGQLKSAGQQLFSINMLSCTYSVTNAVPMLWTPGNSNGWSPEGSGTLTTTDFTNYTGFLFLNGEWLMTPAPNWDNKYALGAGPGTLAYNGASNLPAPAEGSGLYWIDANLGSLTYSTTPITTIGLIGDFNGWGGDVEMTPSDDFLTWTGTLAVEEGQGWKFRCNGDWAVNLGGALDNLENNGGNLSCPAGTYTVTLSLKTHPYTATLTAK